MKTRLNLVFVARPKEADTFGIHIEIDGKESGQVLFVESGCRPMRVCRVFGQDMGWRGSKMQAEQGAAELTELYLQGAIE